MALKLGKSAGELLALGWDDLLLTARCLTECDEALARVVAELNDGDGPGFFPVLSVSHLTGGMLGALAAAASDTQTPKTAPRPRVMNGPQGRTDTKGAGHG